MGKILFDLVQKADPSDITISCRWFFEQICKAVDDNTKDNVVINGKSRNNRIGDHGYLSIRKLSTRTRVSRASISSNFKKLQEAYWMEKSPDQSSPNSAVSYRVNVSKLFRFAVYRETLQHYGLEEQELYTNEPADNRVEMLYNSITAFYPDDFTHPPIKSMYWGLEIPYIEDLDALLEGGEKALEHYWRVTMKKKFGAAAHNTENHETTKNHTTDFSSTDDSTLVELVANQHPYDANWEEFNNAFPYLLYYKSDIPDEDGVVNNYKSIVLGMDHVNEDSLLDADLIEFENDQDREDFFSSNAREKIDDFNSKYGYYIRLFQDEIEKLQHDT